MAAVWAALAEDTPLLTIELAKNTPRGQLTKQTLEQVLASYDLKKYTFTRKIIIEQGATNHATVTINASFASSPDMLLSSFLHEQLHFHLRNNDAQEGSAIAEKADCWRRRPSQPLVP